MKPLNKELVMTQEDKELLLKDLCARLPYGVKCIVTKSRTEEGQKGEVGKITYICLEGVECIGNEPFFSEFGNFKPYLRSMSSMTEEELKEFRACHCVYDLHPDFQPMMCNIANEQNMFDWLKVHYFDYRGLIEKGLAIDATGLNIY